jgi:Xaa-Pro aminopeptidase
MQFVPVPVSLRDLASERRQRVRDALREKDADVLVVSSAENVLYLTGYESMLASINKPHPYAAIISEDQLVLVAPCGDFAPAIYEGFDPADVIPFGRFYFSGETPSATVDVKHLTFAPAMRDGLDRFSKKGRALIESSSLPSDVQELVKSAFKDTQDASQWMLDLRAVKLPGEQSLLRHVANLTERALEAGMKAAAVGVTDKEVSNVVAAAMSAAGGYPRNVTVAGGPTSALADVLSSERPLEKGDLLRFDIGCSYYGYKSDIARTAVIGEPTALQQKYYDALLAGLETAFEKAKTGAVAEAVFSETVRTVEAKGLKPFHRHHVGHAIGLSTYEWPVITPNNTAQLRAGGTFCLETPYYEPGWGGMMVEDTGVITDNGFETFTTMDRSLRIL